MRTIKADLILMHIKACVNNQNNCHFSFKSNTTEHLRFIQYLPEHQHQTNTRDRLFKDIHTTQLYRQYSKTELKRPADNITLSGLTREHCDKPASCKTTTFSVGANNFIGFRSQQDTTLWTLVSFMIEMEPERMSPCESKTRHYSARHRMSVLALGFNKSNMPAPKMSI
jgi:hypothetical protein